MHSYILGFVEKNFIDIIIVAVVILVMYLVLRKCLSSKNGRINKIIYALVIASEKALGNKTGQIKKEQVVSCFYTKYPILSVFISKKVLYELIDLAVMSMNTYLKNHDANLYSLIEEMSITEVAQKMLIDAEG